MDAIGLGWRTDLAVLRHGGSVFEEHGDHLVVRTPANPTYHWGNFVLVTDPAAGNDAERWRAVFATAFPDARHLAIGLPGTPDRQAWLGTDLQSSDVLVADGELSTRDLPVGYRVRPLVSEHEWAASTALNAHCYPGEPEFQALRSASRMAMVARGQLTWFGAFTDDDDLAAELGIVMVEPGVARYQSVLTHPDHRRLGLTSHLLGVAADHARRAGPARLVILVDPNTDAGRLYRAAGFADAETVWQAYSVPSGSIPSASIA